MNARFLEQSYPCLVWNPSHGDIGPCSLDTETTVIEGAAVPTFIIGSAFNGETLYFLKQETLQDFIAANRRHELFFANAAFDLAVIEKATGESPFSLIERGNVMDLLLLAKLIHIGEQGTAEGAFSLEAVAKQYLDADLPKDLRDDQGNLIRLSFGNFLSPHGQINYPEMPLRYLEYAASDAIATYLLGAPLIDRARRIARQRGVDPELLLSHDIQLKAAYALGVVSRNGLTLDPKAKAAAIATVEGEIAKSLDALKTFSWAPGKGSMKSLQSILLKIEEDHAISLPRTRSGKVSSEAKVLHDFSEIPFFEQFMIYQGNKKLRDFLNVDSERIHAGFNPIVATGRTSSYSPNIQNFPRDERIRSMITASPGHVLLDVDYSQIELCALAQITFNRFHESKMRELLNKNLDLHSYFAANMTGKSVDQIDKDGEERRKAKACNFGFPGGLGIESFIQYAKSNYEVLLNAEEAKAYRERWLDTFPEVRAYLDQDEMELLQSSDLLRCSLERLGRSGSLESAAWVFKGIISGNSHTATTVREYTPEEVNWAFSILGATEFPNKNQFRHQIACKRGSTDLWRNFIRSLNCITFPSGRVRANATYCQLKNNPFQGLAADGAKEALYELVKAGFRVVNFIHDEFLIEVPLHLDLKRIENAVKDILIGSMKRYCPDVKIKADAKWMTHWSKKGNLSWDIHGDLRRLDGSLFSSHSTAPPLQNALQPPAT